MSKITDIEVALSDPKVREALEKRGYKIQPKQEELVVKTFKLPKMLALEFYKVVAAKDMKLQDALAEAIDGWLKRNS